MRRNSSAEIFAALAFGIGIGAIIGILFAPQSGEDTREYLVKTTKDRLDDAADVGKGYVRRAQDTLDRTQERAHEIAEAGERAYREARNA